MRRAGQSNHAAELLQDQKGLGTGELRKRDEEKKYICEAYVVD